MVGALERSPAVEFLVLVYPGGIGGFRPRGREATVSGSPRASGRRAQGRNRDRLCL